MMDFDVTVSPLLPTRIDVSPGEYGRRLARHGLAGAPGTTGLEVGPPPRWVDVTHGYRMGSMFVVSAELYDQLRDTYSDDRKAS